MHSYRGGVTTTSGPGTSRYADVDGELHYTTTAALLMVRCSSACTAWVGRRSTGWPWRRC